MKNSNRTEKELLKRYAELRIVYPAVLVGTILLLIMSAMQQECVLCTEFIQKTVSARIFILLESIFLFGLAFGAVERWRIRRLLAQIKIRRDAGIYVEPVSDSDPLDYWDTPHWKGTSLFLLAVTTTLYLCIAFLRLADLRLIWWPNLMMLIIIGTVWCLRRLFPKKARARRAGLAFHTWRVFSAVILAALFQVFLNALSGVLPSDILDTETTIDFHYWFGWALLFQLAVFDKVTLDLEEKISSEPEN